MVNTLTKIERRIEPHLPPYWREHLRFHRMTGYWPDLKHPSTFNEHVMAIKVRDHDERFPVIADKWAVRKYVAHMVGREYLPAVWAAYALNESMDARDLHRLFRIDTAALPERYVVKPTHMSGRVHLVPDASAVDLDALYAEVLAWLNTTYGTNKGEWWYGQMRKRVLFEEWLQDEEWAAPVDYKLYVFNGHCKLVQVDFDRFAGHKQLFFTREGKFVPATVAGAYAYPRPFSLPPCIDDMAEIAETLAKGFTFMRVDLYCLNGERIVFGEMTPTPHSGCGRFFPGGFDRVFGQYFERS